MLRCATWLAPGLPIELFETVSEAIASSLSTQATLASWTESSGPDPDDDPFARDEIDLGFLCAPSYRELAARQPPSVRLVGAAPVFRDARNEGRPVYFAEFVVREGLEATSLADLRGRRIGFNDHHSMSGMLALQARLAELGAGDSFATLAHTGGHRESIALLARGEIDGASIDSNTLLDFAPLPSGLRILETWGPFPVQPVVVRASLTDTTRAIITSTLLSLHEDSQIGRRLRRVHVDRFAPVTEDDYR